MRVALIAALAGTLVAAAACCDRALAASFDCERRGLSLAELAICRDAQLSRTDDQMANRLAGFARRISLGQYLGLRYWHARWAETRMACGDDRLCLVASYRAQARVLDRLQQCLDSSTQRRACLRATLSGEREARQR
jgi:uncharacterized protein